MIAPKYRTTTQACSCPGYWYRRTCRHYRAYREAVALVLAQDVFNVAGIRLRVLASLCGHLRAMKEKRMGSVFGRAYRKQP